MNKRILIGLLLLTASLMAFERIPNYSVEGMVSDNANIIRYLTSLDTSDAGKTLEGVKLSYGGFVLKDDVFLEKIHSARNKSTVCLFKDGTNRVAYAWVESGGQDLPSPRCSPDCELSTLSGDLYTYSEICAGAGVAIVHCVTDNWIKQVRKTK